MEYSKRDKIKKILIYTATAVGVLLIIVFGILFLQATHNASTKGESYSIKKFIIDFGASLRGKPISDPSIFDGGLFPLFGLNGNNNLPIDGTNGTGGTTITTDGTDGVGGNGPGTGGTNPDTTTGEGHPNLDNPGSTGAQTPQCSDGVDNDADGKIDMEDPDCTDPSDYFESTYNWNVGPGDGFYNYDNGSYGPIDFGDFGFDPSYNFDTATEDTTTPTQCVRKDYDFTDEQQALLDQYIREFYRIAPNIRTQSDVDAEHGATESYQSLIDNANRLKNQCVDERTPPDPYYPNDPDLSHTVLNTGGSGILYHFMGARSILENLSNIDPADIPHDISTSIKEQILGIIDPNIGYIRTKTFFPPDTTSLPPLSGDDLVSVLNTEHIGVDSVPGANNDEKMRNADCIVREGKLCDSYERVYLRFNNSQKTYESTFYTESQLIAGGYTIPSDPEACNSIGIGSIANAYISAITVNTCYDDNFWNATGYDPYAIGNARGEMNLGACYVEMLNKYPNFGYTTAAANKPDDARVGIDKKTFWNLVTDCDKMYDGVNQVRQNFESIFNIN